MCFRFDKTQEQLIKNKIHFEEGRFLFLAIQLTGCAGKTGLLKTRNEKVRRKENRDFSKYIAG